MDEDNNNIFSSFDHSFGDEYLFDEVQDDAFFDCYLSNSELDEFLAPSADNWGDVGPTDCKTKITIDESKSIQWDQAKEEMLFIRERLKVLINDPKGKDHDNEVTIEDVILHITGPESPIGLLIQEQLGLSPLEFLQFMRTLCIQAAYKISSTQLFDSSSLLFHTIPMSEEQYNKIWLKLSTTKRRGEDVSFIGAGRREKCIWEYLEDIINDLCRTISISNRTGIISIALDDDKVWVNLTGKNKKDLFGIKYTTHVKANRKGIIAHTAVSTGANVPLGIIFERTTDSTVDCFKRLLDFLFGRNGATDLRNVIIASDRGYMLPNTVFNYLMAHGANFVGTVKRMAQCWPFTFDQKLKETDQRMKIDTKGPATLFVKKISKSAKNVFAIAFRNGTDSVSTAVSSVHRNHHWEGVALYPKELIEYEEDSVSLKARCIQRVTSDLFCHEELIEESNFIEELFESRIDPLTLRQGKNSLLLLFFKDN